ncbi:MAG: hypothetical protein WBQ08_10210, partial [Candidatus Sulfotelmatobacter sp.]
TTTSVSPDAKDKLKRVFAAAKVSAEIEVYSALHGWCVSDMPIRDGVPIYNKAEAERAGRNSSPYIKWLWHSRYPIQLRRPINPTTGCTAHRPPSQSTERDQETGPADAAISISR